MWAPPSPEVGIHDRNATRMSQSTISNVFLQFEFSRVIRPRLTAVKNPSMSRSRLRPQSRAVTVKIGNGISLHGLARRDLLMAGNWISFSASLKIDVPRLDPQLALEKISLRTFPLPRFPPPTSILHYPNGLLYPLLQVLVLSLSFSQPVCHKRIFFLIKLRL